MSSKFKNDSIFRKSPWKFPYTTEFQYFPVFCRKLLFCRIQAKLIQMLKATHVEDECSSTEHEFHKDTDSLKIFKTHFETRCKHNTLRNIEATDCSLQQTYDTKESAKSFCSV